MFTIKARHGDRTDLMTCDSPAITHGKDGSVAVFLIGGRFDGKCLQVGGEPMEHVTPMDEIIIENTNGKTTEIFRA